jgi:putative membrane-bound dehydrogenase-like protein
MRSLAFLILAASPLAAAEAPLRALLVCGGCCHDYETQSALLRDGIQARANVQVDVIRSEDNGTKPWFPIYEDKDWAKGYDVVIHDECAADVKDMPYVQHVIDAHKNGVAAVNLHCAMHSYRTGDDRWFEFLGLQSTGHGWQKPIEIDFTVAEHPVTKGLANWTTGDEELYNSVKVFGTATPLALGSQVQGDGKKDSAVVVWTNDFHGTRGFSTTIGHNNSTVGDARYLDLVTRGLLWSCDKLNAAYLKPYAGPKGRTTVVPPRSEMRGEPPANATLVTATASSVQPDNWIWKAVDGAPDTRWCADGASFPQWYQLEFDKPQKLSGVKIVWESGNNAYRHVIEGSVDGQQWTVLSDAKENDKPGDTSAEFALTEVKFLKITCSGTSQGGWSSIREISAVGEGVGPLFAKIPEAEKAKIADPYQKRGNTIPKIEKLTPEEEAAILNDVKVAEGFDVSLFATASAANYPVYVAASPGGDVYVASDGNGSVGREPNRGRIVRLRDTDKDGRADQVTEFVKDVDSPRGMVWDHDRLYVVHPPDVSVFIDHDRDGQADEQKTLITGIAFGFKDRPADHTTNGLSLGIDGWLYIAGGDFGFMEATGTDGRKVQHRNGGVIRFRPDGSGLEIFSTGTRNILGTPISPLLDLFSRDNTNDGGGWDVRLHHFTGLEDHGYPRMYINFVDEIVKPLADYGGGSGCGSVYISEPGIPKPWNDAPFTCDWGTGALWKHTVEPRGATFAETAKPEPLVRVTRPTDADVDGMSAIYQASWKGATFNWEGPDVGYIVRVTPKGYTPEPLPDFEKLSDVELIQLLESPSQVRAMEAQRALNRRPANAAMAQGLVTLARDTSKPLTGRVAAVFALADRGLKADAAGPVITLLTPLANDPQLQRFVLRALGDMGLDQLASGKSSAPAEVFAAGLKSADPRTRLEAVVGATRQNLKVLGNEIATQLGDADPVLAHTAFRGLAMLGAAEACFAVVDRTDAPSAQRTGALRALMRMHQPAVVDGLLARLDQPAQAAGRNDLLGALCRLHFHEGTWKGDSWGTRPDTRGPYYQPEAWSETPKIAAALKAALAKATPAEAAFLAREMKLNRIESNDALDRLLALVSDNAALIPDVVTQLAASDNIPAPAIPILLKAAAMDGPPDLLARAIAILAKTDSAEGCEVSLAALAKLPAGKERDQARQAFLAAPKLENHHLLLEKRAEKMDGGTATWADAALLTLSARKEGSPESRELSGKAINKGWLEPKRRIQILQAIRLTDFHGLDEQVQLAVNDADAAVAKEAAETAKHLKLEQPVEDKTPLVSTLKPEEVVAEMLKIKGSVALGQQLFTRQTCNACHAASMDEPQKGPFLGTIAQTYTRTDLAMNIIDPGKTIAQGFATEMFTLKDGTAQMGFVTFESADEVKVRNIAAQEFTYKTGDIAKREKLPNSLMPPGLVNGLTLREFASLLDYLESLSKK